MDLTTFFKLGMKRDLPTWVNPPHGAKLSMGSGNQKIPGFINYDAPEFNFDSDLIPQPDNNVAEIIAFHFLEHLHDPIRMLREFERVLMVNGVAWIVVPYGTCHMAIQDMSHRHFFNEESWRTLFQNHYYSQHGKWRLAEIGSVIMGINGKNLALLTQLIRQSN